MRGKVVLITGASSGIGAGTSVHFASKGCLLALTGRSDTGLQETYNACLDAGAKEDQILMIQADLENDEDVRKVLNNTIEKFERLDVLVNNAGITKRINFLDSSVDNFDQMIKVNLRSAYFLTQYAMPHLIKSKGNVVNVSTIASTRYFHHFMLYAMSKAAMDHFSRYLAREMAPFEVRVNSVNPAMINGTNIFQRGGITEDLTEAEKRCHALGRPGTIEEVAKAILFLADNEMSSFTTGNIFNVDGGCSMMGPH